MGLVCVVPLPRASRYDFGEDFAGSEEAGFTAGCFFKGAAGCFFKAAAGTSGTLSFIASTFGVFGGVDTTFGGTNGSTLVDFLGVEKDFKVVVGKASRYELLREELPVGLEDRFSVSMASR